MSFDWSEYLTLAHGLLDPHTDIATLEARCRAAISRAYYAAFGKAKNYLRDVAKDREIPSSGRVHEYVIRQFLSNADSTHKKIGEILRDLRRRRNMADYDDDIANILSDAIFGVKDASDVLDMLVSLSTEMKVQSEDSENKLMHPKDRILDDLKTAMKAGDTSKRDALRLLSSAIKQAEIDTRTTLTEEQINSLLQTEAKKRRDTITEMQKAGREDIAAKEAMELALIESYLPTQLTREQIEEEVRKAISESGAQSAKDMGNVMKVLMPRVKGLADGKLVNEVVKSLLN